MSECSICENQLTGGEAPFRWCICSHCCWQKLEQQAGKGCKICGLFYQALLPSEKLLVRLERFWISSFWRTNETVQIEIWDKNPFRPLCSYELYTEPGERKSPNVTIGSSHHIPQDPQSEECYQRVGSWVRECVENHPCCQSLSGSTDQLPDRVIDVDSEKPRLRETGRQSGQYLTLSHCWGTESPLRTTKATIETWKRGIPWTSLPKTFQDAILLTRKLGLRYIWIDSICIIQDDAQDWDIQSTQMPAIYGGSYLTIAAAGAWDSRGGCYMHRPGPQRLIFEHNNVAMPVYARNLLSHSFLFFHVGNSRWSEASDPGPPECPLFRRAWCFQEQLLSRRILYFTPLELVFDCCFGYRCECEDALVNRSQRRNRLYEHVKSRYHHIVQKYWRPYPSIFRLQMWRDIVLWYTRRHITYDKDAPIAISGVASQMYDPKLKVYMAGMWSKLLEYQLLWKAAHGNHRSTKYLGPSFSWLSSRGPIFDWPLPSKNDEIFVTIMEARCVPAGHNPYGTVASGSLRLHGLIFATRLAADVACERGYVTLNGPSDTPEQFEVTLDALEELDELSGLELICMPILMQGYSPRVMYFLVLRPLENQTGFFRRVGLLTCSGDINEPWPKNICWNENWNASCGQVVIV